MEAIRSRKEFVVVSFFWLILVLVSLMAIGNGIKHLKASRNPVVAGQAGSNTPAGPMGNSPSYQEADLKRQIEENPKNMDAMIKLGDIYYDGNQPQKAIKIFETALKVDPDSIHVQTDLAMLYLKVNRADDSMARFRDVLRLRPEELKAHYFLGHIYRFNKGDNKTALEHFRKILSSNPDDSLRKAANQQIDEIRASGETL